MACGRADRPFPFGDKSCLLGKLAQWTYQNQEIAKPGKISEVPAGGSTFTVKLLRSKIAPKEFHQAQWSVWEVEGMDDDGVAHVLAFRGTANLYDACTDLEIVRLPLTGLEDFRVHQGIYTAVSGAYQEVAPFLKSPEVSQSTSPFHLYVTGHSLGGGLALAFMMLALLEKDSMLVSGMLHGGVVTFGAPLVMAKVGENQGSVEECIRKLVSDCGVVSSSAIPTSCLPIPIHNFVNGLDIVPRLLGTAIISIIKHVRPLIMWLAEIPLTALRLVPGFGDSLKKFVLTILKKIHEYGPGLVGSYVPVGVYHLINGAAADKALHIVEKVSGQLKLNEEKLLAFKFGQLIKHHRMDGYLESITLVKKVNDPGKFLDEFTRCRSMLQSLTVKVPEQAFYLQANGTGVLLKQQGSKWEEERRFLRGTEVDKWVAESGVGAAGSSGSREQRPLSNVILHIEELKFWQENSHKIRKLLRSMNGVCLVAPDAKQFQDDTFRNKHKYIHYVYSFASTETELVNKAIQVLEYVKGQVSRTSTLRASSASSSYSGIISDSSGSYGRSRNI